jgi:hypothetical protein
LTWDWEVEVRELCAGFPARNLTSANSQEWHMNNLPIFEGHWNHGVLYFCESCLSVFSQRS